MALHNHILARSPRAAPHYQHQKITFTRPPESQPGPAWTYRPRRRPPKPSCRRSGGPGNPALPRRRPNPVCLRAGSRSRQCRGGGFRLVLLSLMAVKASPSLMGRTAEARVPGLAAWAEVRRRTKTKRPAKGTSARQEDTRKSFQPGVRCACGNSLTQLPTWAAMDPVVSWSYLVIQ